jgi:hypothetical protein
MKLFLSATYRDLIDDRAAALGEMDRLGQAVAMERFGAQAYPALDVCLGELADCKVMILLLGGRYGSVVPDLGISYTEAEFRYAQEHDIPVLAFLKEQLTGVGGRREWVNGESDADQRGRLDAFKEDVGRVVVWERYVQPTELPLLIQREVSAAERRHGRLSLRGRSLVTTTRYLPRAADGTLALNHARPLVGRSDVLSTLVNAAHDGTALLCVLGGRGGIGKTRLLLELAHRVEAESGWSVRWVRSDVAVAPDVSAELPHGNVAIIADDAHRRTDLSSLMRLVTQRGREGMRTLLICGTRPWGKGIIKAAARDAEIGANELVDAGDLQPLRRPELRRLLEDELGPEYAEYADFLVQTMGESTLVALVAAGSYTSDSSQFGRIAHPAHRAGTLWLRWTTGACRPARIDAVTSAIRRSRCVVSSTRNVRLAYRTKPNSAARSPKTARVRRR